MSIHTTLACLRMHNNLTQEKLAEQLSVSCQTIQNWESGIGEPDLINVIKIAKCFDVTIDSLVLDSDQRSCKKECNHILLYPEYITMDTWESYAADLMVEYQQCLDEGRDILIYKELFAAVHQIPAGPLKTRIADLLFELTINATMVDNYLYNEPSDLYSIRALSTTKNHVFTPLTDRQALRDRIHGAWMGRICGCLLGKPIEGISTAELHSLLKESDNWPMHRYILSTDITPEMLERFKYHLQNKCYADTITCAPVDDDTNYTVMAQVLLSLHGRDFTSNDVAQVWMDYQPKKVYATAERVAFCNFVKGFRPPQSAQWQNPYRELIGAQIRGDYYGYINPGNPTAAAEMAWRDARISHVKNGIYGEMFIAAIIAQAAVEQDITKLIRTGLGEIPCTSRLYESVSYVLKGYESGTSMQECTEKIHSTWNEHTLYGWCHTIPNAMIVTAALLFGGGNYGRSICMAVQEGFDTDCNGATVGSILGMRGGIAAIGTQWSAPVMGILDTSVFGVSHISIEDAVEKTLSHLQFIRFDLPSGIDRSPSYISFMHMQQNAWATTQFFRNGPIMMDLSNLKQEHSYAMK